MWMWKLQTVEIDVSEQSGSNLVKKILVASLYENEEIPVDDENESEAKRRKVDREST